MPLLDLIILLFASESGAKAIRETEGPLGAFEKLYDYADLNAEKPTWNIVFHLLGCMRCVSFWIAAGLAVVRLVGRVPFILLAAPLLAWRFSKTIYDALESLEPGVDVVHFSVDFGNDETEA